MDVSHIGCWCVITFRVRNVNKKLWAKYKKPLGWRATRRPHYVRFRCEQLRYMGFMTPEQADTIQHMLILMKDKQES